MVAPFHSDADSEHPVYHDTSDCPYGREIKSNGNDKPGTDGGRLCDWCAKRGLGRMKLEKALLDELMVQPGESAGLVRRSTESTTIEWKGSDKNRYKKVAQEDLASFVDELSEAQRLFWANDTHALLDRPPGHGRRRQGRDHPARDVGRQPAGLQGRGLQAAVGRGARPRLPVALQQVLPERGMIGIFTGPTTRRSWSSGSTPNCSAGATAVSGDGPPEQVWSDRYEDINAFERHLAPQRDADRQALPARLEGGAEAAVPRAARRPGQELEVLAHDLAERRHWDEYPTAYEEVLSATSSPWAPWYVVPADHKYALRALVGGIVVNAIDQMDLQPPQIKVDDLEALFQAKIELLAE